MPNNPVILSVAVNCARLGAVVKVSTLLPAEKAKSAPLEPPYIPQPVPNPPVWKLGAPAVPVGPMNAVLTRVVDESLGLANHVVPPSLVSISTSSTPAAL